MLQNMSRSLRSMTLVAGLAVAALPAWGETYPSSPVHLIVAYAAGGTGDVVARIVAPKLSTALGQSVIVENRAGASGAIGARSVAVANPAARAAKPSAIAKPSARRRATNAMMAPASAALAAAHQAGSRSAVN